MAFYEVVEHFISINGEGTRAGELAFFIRLKGCNLNCSYCDTKWANEKNVDFKLMSDLELADLVRNSGIKNVTLTGGEPLYRDNMEALISAFDNDINVEIETNGSVNLAKYSALQKRPSFTMDYKLGESNMEDKMCLDNFSYLCSEDTVKFVVGSIRDLERANEIINQYSLLDKVHVYFSPVFGRIDPVDIVNYMTDKKINKARLQLQLHKFIWDPEKRGV